jgi:hypothetical protein
MHCAGAVNVVVIAKYEVAAVAVVGVGTDILVIG